MNYNQLKDILENICEDDRKAMFGKTFVSSILINLEDTERELTKYEEYIIPVSLGDVIEYSGEEYVVTCVYTDNSADILSKDGKQKQNVGFYMKNVKRIGKLEVIQEG